MGFYIKCPFFDAYQNNTISCEGCTHYFDTRQKRDKQIAKCEEGGTGCKYASKLLECYETYQDSPDLELKLHECYCEESRNQILTLVWRLSREKNAKRKLDENFKDALKVKENDVNRLTRQLMLERKKVNINEQTIFALMHENNLNIDNVIEIIEKHKDKELVFDAASGKVKKNE